MYKEPRLMLYSLAISNAIEWFETSHTVRAEHVRQKLCRHDINRLPRIPEWRRYPMHVIIYRGDLLCLVAGHLYCPCHHHALA